MYSELWASVMSWAVSTGAKDINKLPGLWHHKTEARDGVGPIDVRINAHSNDVDGLPPFHVKLGMDGYFPGIIGIFGPHGGALISSPIEGENENGLIAHFKAQTPAEFRHDVDQQ